VQKAVIMSMMAHVIASSTMLKPRCLLRLTGKRLALALTALLLLPFGLGPDLPR
jgi:hypothetical protein